MFFWNTHEIFIMYTVNLTYEHVTLFIMNAFVLFLYLFFTNQVTIPDAS